MLGKMWRFLSFFNLVASYNMRIEVRTFFSLLELFCTQVLYTRFISMVHCSFKFVCVRVKIKICIYINLNLNLIFYNYVVA